MALHVGGDQHVVVVNLHYVFGDDRLDRLTGQHDRHPITEARQANRPAMIHPPPHAGMAQIPMTVGRVGLRLRNHRGDGIHHLRIGAGGANANRSAGGRIPSDWCERSVL
jgi:hypothetical protein